MWWSDDDRDGQVSVALDRLDQLAVRDVLLGYGAAFYRGETVPLLVAREDLDPRPYLLAPGRQPSARIARWLVRGRDIAPHPSWFEEQVEAADDRRLRLGPKPMSAKGALGRARVARRGAQRGSDIVERGLAVPLRIADERTRRIADRARLPQDSLVTYWPMPGQAVAISGGRRGPTGSRGLSLVCEGCHPRFMGQHRHQPFVGTAGHLDVNPGQPLFGSKARRWRFRGGPIVGLVRWRADPRSPPSSSFFTDNPAGMVDFSLAEAVTERWSGGTALRTVASEVRDGELCEWRGARSGITRGDIVGALRTLTVDGTDLRNCWYVASDCRRGDSGAAVWNLRRSAALGQIVGSRGVSRRRGARPGTIVQDVETLLAAGRQLSDGCCWEVCRP